MSFKSMCNLVKHVVTLDVGLVWDVLYHSSLTKIICKI